MHPQSASDIANRIAYDLREDLGAAIVWRAPGADMIEMWFSIEIGNPESR